MKRLACVLSLLALPGLVCATGRCVVTPAYVAPYVAPVKAVKVVDYKAAAIVYPVYPYAAGYNPGYELGYRRGADEERLAQAIQALTQRIGSLEQRLAAGPAAPAPAPQGPAPMPPAEPHDPFAPREEEKAPTPQEAEGLAVLRAQCASCHDPSRGAVKGELALLDGGRPLALTCEQILAVSRKVYLGEMPPRGPLSPEDTGRVMALMATTKPGR